MTAALGLLYVVTKYGQMYVCDLETATVLFASAVSTSIIFATALNTNTQVGTTFAIMCLENDWESIVEAVMDGNKHRGAGRGVSSVG